MNNGDPKFTVKHKEGICTCGTWNMEHMDTSWQPTCWSPREKNCTSCQGTWQVWYSDCSIQWNKLHWRGSLHGTQIWFHILLKWPWSWWMLHICHGFCSKNPSHTQALEPSHRTKKLPNDSLTPLVRKEATGCHQCLCIYHDQPWEVKEKFYDDLNTLIKSGPRYDKVILLGDFNSRVGTDYKTWSNMIGENGVGKCNSNGLLLLKFCAEHGLLITYSFTCAFKTRCHGCIPSQSTGI